MLWFFSHANVHEARSILHCLTTYSRWSRQCINISKSATFFSIKLHSCFYFRNQWYSQSSLISSRAKYLHIPLFMHCNKRGAFIDIIARIYSMISRWKAKLLSQAARTTLLKSVANAIPMYLMPLFLLPKTRSQLLSVSFGEDSPRKRSTLFPFFLGIEFVN